MPSERWTGVLVYPNTVARSYVLRLGRTLAQHLTEVGIARDLAIIEAPSAGHAGCHAESRQDPGRSAAGNQTVGTSSRRGR